MLKRTAIALLAAILLVIPAGAATRRPSFMESVRPLQTVNPMTGIYRNICTTTSINKDKHYWLTAEHCVAGGREIFVEGHKAYVVKESAEADIAVIAVPGMTVKGLKMQPRESRWGQRIQMAGHPFGYDSAFLVKGWVSNPSGYIGPVYPYDKEYMLMNISCAGGNSGSSVLNLKGEVVSVLQVGWGNGFSPVCGGATFSDLVKVAWKYFKE